MNHPSPASTPTDSFWTSTLPKDIAVAAALVIALAAVYGVDKWSAAGKPSPTAVPQIETTEIDAGQTATELSARRLRLGVTPPQYDDMGRLLESLGEGYQYRTVRLEELLDPGRLEDFDILFLTCGGVPDSWLGERLRDGPRVGTETRRARPEVMEKVRDNLRSFVERGGTLYASDWHFGLIETAFEEFVDRPRVTPGAKQTVTAEVVDTGLQERIGREIELRFDLPDWYPAAFRGRELTIYLRGRYQTQEGRRGEAPLLVKFPFGQGHVIFTSFHNEKQNSRLEMELLRYLVFAAVTAQAEAKATETMVKGGFSPASKSLLSASADARSVTRTYQAKKAGDLRFALGFENQGALLRLQVVGPDGEEYTKEGQSTFTLEVPAAAAGEWKYTVTAVKMPYDKNFPFTLVIGEK